MAEKQHHERCTSDESIDGDNYLSGHQTLPALAASLERAHPSSDEIGEAHAQSVAVHSEEANRENLGGVDGTAQDAVAALEGTALQNESASDLRQRLKALKKQEQELVRQQWKANKLEKVRTSFHKDSCVVVVTSSLSQKPTAIGRDHSNDSNIIVQANVTRKLRHIRKEMQGMPSAIEVIIWRHMATLFS